MVALLIGAVAEILWCIYLGVVLPPHYVAEHWALAWIGLDIAEISMLFAAAWAAWRQRALIILFTDRRRHAVSSRCLVRRHDRAPR